LTHHSNPQQVWQYFSLKLGSFEVQLAEKRVGKITLDAAEALLQLLDDRIAEYQVKPSTEHEASQRFVDSESDMLRRVKEGLAKEVAQLIDEEVDDDDEEILEYRNGEL
jgi:pyruvate/2-oxoacid:ferredoxin oxidoreductase beta subunit